EKSEPIRLGFGIGFLGALTTFSTFGAETIGHVNEGNLIVAFGNVAINVLLGLIFVFLGILAGRKMA
ncbi:CrcB family protein, partial [Mariniblastus sp.]|nr:CrcB family protein [Mariniblastus sp.]